MLYGKTVGDNIKIIRAGQPTLQDCYGSYGDCTVNCPAPVWFSVPPKLIAKWEKAYDMGMGVNVDRLGDYGFGSVVVSKGSPVPTPPPQNQSYIKLCVGAMIRVVA